ncbi:MULTISPECIES: TetR/AcrR family transcriptional regulator [Thalassospira]|uniref:TetR/AcrR family transcriptional regulator n=1 Tax=Thalassospira TaxID=168934 RepID=UPI0008DE1C9C|nr:MULTISPECIES: TetR family transcriptional regulator [Thalassospira]MAB35418.1 TetR/AcrR family transcriptional regulator [Thalassospira sp.]MDM7976913.1 TetR family transcriptional regulator [Thalassospira xiamenensis]OHY99282.1 TetR family transcriptional regulator [Thalassospira sp. MIT1004]HBS21520.1 TetR/AcrR family transcriptional regulator [Thalassospira sp.]|tara:strand:- start:1329 stop:1871 length:543 start_codon:yes stop_codon:yes gene_type:complete
MTDTKLKIAAGLERAFAKGGFAEPSVDDLREAADVSLRTLYKYTPSRADMVHLALEHRHQRYIDLLFTDLPEAPDRALSAIIDRVGVWMETEASHGCLFHAAVAASPGDQVLRDLLARHKTEVATKVAIATGRQGYEIELNLILEGLTQSFTLHGAEAIAAAKRLAGGLPSSISTSNTIP